MGIAIAFIKQLQHWDLASKLALALALLLLVLALLLLALAPALRFPATIAVVGLLLVLQILVLSGNRHLVTPYTQAQRHFMVGEFEAARDVLLAHCYECEARGKLPDVDVLVLLGNTYRSLGDLRQSLLHLRQAYERRPKSAFACYGLGRSLLAQGEYDQAIVHIRQALALGAPQTTQFDLAHALYRADEHATALRLLQGLPPEQEAFRQLMAAYLLHRLTAAPAPTAALLREGLPFWKAEAARFAATPYGLSIAQDVQKMSHLL